MGVNIVSSRYSIRDWFDTLCRRSDLTEVNFWAPSAANFRALQPGELFLFKLHAPRNVIVGGGIFAYANALLCSLAWQAFGDANGAHSAQEMRARIARYRKADPGDRSDFEVGCRILTQPFFLEEADWIAVPPSWAANIVSFKTYNTGAADGLALWDAVEGSPMGGTPQSVAEPGYSLWRAPAHPAAARPGRLPRAGDGHLSAPVRRDRRAHPARARSRAHPPLW